VFYYYGRKKKMARLYPEPQHPLIVEPFAGSAAYSLHGDRWTRKVVLVERDPEIAALWRWLIQDATPDDILSLPNPEVGAKTDNLLLILHMASKRWHTYRQCAVTPFLKSAWSASRAYMAANIHRVKHWEIIEGDYTDAPDEEATWFIDPPYQGDPGTGYRFGSDLLDYDALGAWCRQRKGAVIVCEGAGATWLPFRPLTLQKGAAGKENHEVIWTDGFTDALSLFG